MSDNKNKVFDELSEIMNTPEMLEVKPKAEDVLDKVPSINLARDFVKKWIKDKDVKRLNGKQFIVKDMFGGKPISANQLGNSCFLDAMGAFEEQLRGGAICFAEKPQQLIIKTALVECLPSEVATPLNGVDIWLEQLRYQPAVPNNGAVEVRLMDAWRAFKYFMEHNSMGFALGSTKFAQELTKRGFVSKYIEHGRIRVFFMDRKVRVDEQGVRVTPEQFHIMKNWGKTGRAWKWSFNSKQWEQRHGKV